MRRRKIESSCQLRLALALARVHQLPSELSWPCRRCSSLGVSASPIQMLADRRQTKRFTWSCGARKGLHDLSTSEAANLLTQACINGWTLVHLGCPLIPRACVHLRRKSLDPLVGFTSAPGTGEGRKALANLLDMSLSIGRPLVWT